MTDEPIDAIDAASWRGRLLAERADVVRRVAAHADNVSSIIAATDGANTDDEHDPEGATIAFERSQAQALGAASQRRLTEIDAALERVTAGTYGHCSVCGRPIDPARLVARLTANTCMECAAVQARR